MARQHEYIPNRAHPYIPAEAAANELRKQSIDAPGGCRLWVGRLKREQLKPQLKLNVYRPNGRRITVVAHKLTWWVHHGIYPMYPKQMVQTCGNPACVAIEHLRINLLFDPLPQWPYVTKEVIRQRLAAHSIDAPGGCRLWTGFCRMTQNKKRGAGIMRLMPGDGRPIHVAANRMAWWLAYGSYPREPQMMRPTCKNAGCINVDHLRLTMRHSLRKLTDAQVVEARALFWVPFLSLNKNQRRMAVPTPEKLAAWHLGMTLTTLLRVMRGQPLCPKKWVGTARTPLEVRLMVERCRDEHNSRLADKQRTWTALALAQRYKMTESTMFRLLNGRSYKHVPMPREADEAVQQAAREALNDRREQARSSAWPACDAAAPAQASPPAA